MTGDLLRLVTAGSVDDGKSTLVGRLLYDTKSVLSDQLEALERTSAERGLADLDLAMLVDGLRAEREQGITIDVAYRYFATRRRSFVLADTPGHVQYLRNTVTGASTADHAVVLVDARNGVVAQTRRHLAVMAMLGVPTVTIAVNKLDLVGYSRETYDRIRRDVAAYACGLGYADDELTTIPLSALVGDNVVTRSDETPWYDGPILVERLETVEPDPRGSDVGLRMPVQYVIRDAATGYRGYAGRLAAGDVAAGDEVCVLPSGARTVVARVDTPDGPVPGAGTGSAVTLVLRDELDIGRGDLITAGTGLPAVTDDLDATVCWLAEKPLRPGRKLLLKHGTRTTRAVVTDLSARFDEQRLALTADPEDLTVNGIGHVRLLVAEPLPVDRYRDCKPTGAFLLIDPADGNTVAAGLLGNVLSGVVGAPTQAVKKE